jgi:hypothetical protein
LNIDDNKFLPILFCVCICCLFIVISIIELYQKSENPFQNIALLIIPLIYISLLFALRTL